MLDHLGNTTANGTIFNPEELGYYSYSSLCIQNIYGNLDSLVEYKIAYMVCVAIFLILVSASYIAIVVSAYRSAHRMNRMAAHAAQNSNTDLSVKVMLMIGSQLGCWISFIILMILYSVTNIYAPQLLYELTAVLIFPMNSYLNPIFNSFLYKKMLVKCKEMKEWVEGRREVVEQIEMVPQILANPATT